MHITEGSRQVALLFKVLIKPPAAMQQGALSLNGLHISEKEFNAMVIVLLVEKRKLGEKN